MGVRQGGTMIWLYHAPCSRGPHNIHISSTGLERWRDHGLHAIDDLRRVRQAGRDLELTSYVAGETFGRMCLIPKLTNADSSFPTSCRACRSKNANRIKHLDGRDKPRTTPQMGRKQRQLVLALVVKKYARLRL
jgi:hypothetical protein